MRYSKQREALIEILLSTRSHPDADWLYSEMKKKIPNISLATVYRNLSRLKENGDIICVPTKDDKEHYDGYTHYHAHFVCDECKKIIDIELEEDKELQEKISKENNADIKSQELTFYGLCSDCKNMQ